VELEKFLHHHPINMMLITQWRGKPKYCSLNFVIPAQAGIQTAYPSSGDNQGPLDSRLRGNDEIMGLCT
jgi:hypothetical protein